MNTTNQAKQSKRTLISKGWDYLNENFHKFSEDNRIRIALELVKKDMPTILEGEMSNTVTMMPSVKIDDKELKLDTGD